MRLSVATSSIWSSFVLSVFLHCVGVFLFILLFCFKQKTAYEMRISDCGSDVCSSDLQIPAYFDQQIANMRLGLKRGFSVPREVLDGRDVRTGERRVGKEGVSTCRSRRSVYHSNRKRA